MGTGAGGHTCSSNHQPYPHPPRVQVYVHVFKQLLAPMCFASWHQLASLAGVAAPICTRPAHAKLCPAPAGASLAGVVASVHAVQVHRAVGGDGLDAAALHLVAPAGAAQEARGWLKRLKLFADTQRACTAWCLKAHSLCDSGAAARQAFTCPPTACPPVPPASFPASTPAPQHSPPTVRRRWGSRGTRRAWLPRHHSHRHSRRACRSRSCQCRGFRTRWP